MKKLNRKGFTLIELLAVITILGILMLVAIPAVSRTIENSRRDTFADNAKNYINTVRNAALADELKCGTGVATDPKYSATEDGWYYFNICTTDVGTSGATCKAQDTEDLMEKVAKSSWGGAELYGVVIWHKDSQKSTYYAIFADSAKHGMTGLAEESDIKRKVVETKGAFENKTTGNKALYNSANWKIMNGTTTVVDASSAKKCTLDQ